MRSNMDIYHPIYNYLKNIPNIGQGPGAFMYSEGFNKVVFKTEWTYLELVRNYGLFSLIIIGVFAKPLLRCGNIEEMLFSNACFSLIFHIYS